jgi:dGTPase
MGKKVVSDLLQLFWEGVEGYDHKAGTYHFPNKVWEMLSLNYRHVFEHGVNPPFKKGGELDYHLALHLVADHVCGMTDTFACQLHRELFNAS